MDLQTRERLVGAAVLVVVVVLLVPSILTGGGNDDPGTAAAVPEAPGEAAAVRSIELSVAPAASPADQQDVLMPEPGPAAPVPAAGMPAAELQDPAAAVVMPGPGPETPPTPGPAAAVDGTPAWAIQLGAFSTRAAAERLVGDLRGRGYAAFVLEYRAGGGLLYRVRVGPEQDRGRADAVAERLKKDGFKPIVAPHP